MNDWLQAQTTIALRTHRCWECGSYWAAEGRLNDGGCPVCQRATLSQLRAEVARLDRVAASLRGVITRLTKKRRGKG